MANQPNFLFIMTDQLRPDHTGFGGNQIVQTPHLDRLSSQSIQFNRAYCTNPMCGPSRASIFTGRMPSAHGSWVNIVGLDWFANTFVRVLREGGYQTGLIGKSHLQEFMSLGDRVKGQPNLSLDTPPPTNETLKRRFPLKGEGDAVRAPYPVDWNLWEDQIRHREEYVQIPSDYYGFDRVELVCSHADLPDGHYRHWFAERGGDIATMGGYDNAARRSKVWKQVYCSNIPADLYPTSY
ncbi:MAG: sulfatase-like hydrolase/transferase, partial [Chloroflexota bacterium]